MNNQEIAAKCAEIMGRALFTSNIDEWPDHWLNDKSKEKEFVMKVDDWNPPEDLNQAVEVADKVGLWEIKKLENGGYLVFVWVERSNFKITTSNSPAKALCLACIEAWERGKDGTNV